MSASTPGVCGRFLEGRVLFAAPVLDVSLKRTLKLESGCFGTISAIIGLAATSAEQAVVTCASTIWRITTRLISSITQ